MSASQVLAPLRRRLSREVAAALLIKLMLLGCLWALFFKGHADKQSAAAVVEGWFPSAPVAGTSRPQQP